MFSASRVMGLESMMDSVTLMNDLRFSQDVYFLIAQVSLRIIIMLGCACAVRYVYGSVFVCLVVHVCVCRVLQLLMKCK